MGFSTKSVLCDRTYPVDFMSAGNVVQLQRTEDFSFVVWFKTSYTGGVQRLFYKMWSGPKGYGLAMEGTGKLQWYMVNTWTSNALVCETTSFGWYDGNWHCAIVTHDTSLGAGTVAAMKIYVDGQLQTLSTVYDTLTTDIPTNAANFTIGISQQDGIGFDGYIDSVAVYRGKVLSTTEIGWIYNQGITQNLKHANAPSGLTNWWRMGETITGDGEIADEGADYDSYSPLSRSIQPTTTYPGPIPDPQESIRFPHASHLSHTKSQPFSAGIWIKAGGGNVPMFNKLSYPSPYRGWYMRLSAGANFSATIKGDNNVNDYINRSLNGPFNDGIWHLLGFTYDGSNTVAGLLTYHQGVASFSAISGSTIVGVIENTAGLYISEEQGGWYGDWPCNFCHSFIVNRVVTPAEWVRIYGGGTPQDLSAIFNSSDLLHWSALGDGCTTASFPDLSTFSNDGSGNNLETADFQNDVPGAPGYVPLTQSIELNNGSSDEYIDFGLIPAADFLNTDDCSMGAWVKFVDQGGNHQQTLLCKHRTGGSDIAFFLHAIRTSGNPAYLYMQYGTGPVYSYARYSQPPSWATRGPVLEDGSWHLILFRRLGSSNPEIFVDHVRQSESLGSYQPSPGLDADGTFTVGAYKSGGVAANPVHGNVCHAFIYNKQLTYPDMAAIYNDGVPPDLSVVGPTSNLVFWSAMGDGDAIGAGNVLDLSGNANHGTYVNGDSGDFVSDVPTAPFDLTLQQGASVANEAPVGNEYSTYYEDPANIPLYTFQQDTFPQYEYDSYHEDPGNIPTHTWQATSEFEPTLWYRMRGIDTTCPPAQQPAYVFWTVVNVPDWDASELSAGDLICGTDPSTDVDDIQIAGEWVEGEPC
jgi:hypothetical protein